MADPRCPYCNTQGIKHLAAKQIGHYTLVYCGQCGAIYGVVPLPPAQAPADRPDEAPKAVSSAAAAPAEARPKAVSPSAAPPAAAPKPDLAPGPPAPKDPDTEKLLLQEVGQADLSTKEPLSPERMQAKLHALRTFRPGTQYMRIAYDDGPPCCPHHQLEMVQFTIPEGYQNAGRKIWRCPQYKECKQWELAE
jgi:hypothetical protein